MDYNVSFYRVFNSLLNKNYIGVCLDFNKRKGKHLSDLRRNKNNPYLQEDFNNYGNFEVILIENFTGTREEIKDRENYWMDFYKSHIPTYGKEFGYNINKAQLIPSLETRSRISTSVSGENNPRFGVSLNEETKDKISKSNIGKKGLSGENNPMYGKYGSKNPNNKVDENKIKRIKETFIELYKENLFGLTELDTVVANIYGISDITARRIRYGQNSYSNKIGGSLKDWLKEKKDVL